MVINKFDFNPSLYFGHTVVIKTCDGNIYEGEFYCYDNRLNFIIVKEDNNSKNINSNNTNSNNVNSNSNSNNNKNDTANFYIIKISIIVDIETKRKMKNSWDPVPTIDPNIVEKVERKAIDNFKKNKMRIGVGITKEAQDLFDFIWKTHPDCAWSNKDILVLNGDIRIQPPYGPDNCVAKNEKLKERFTTVISKFRQKKNMSVVA
ncbi:lsm12, putative [Hepatocystis sp. ex Piliocolobus tephrosceles]|nr:lsm12, putative [Hepatocystis sp. ex Piliocolobus tephrosceles]